MLRFFVKFFSGYAGFGARQILGMLVICLGAAVLPPASADSRAETSGANARLKSLAAEVADDYPEVRHISIAELKAEFSDALLVDVREREEYEMSHLPGAVHAPEPEDVDALRALYPDKALVFYCTVGVRSAIAAQNFLTRSTLGPAAAEPVRAVNLSGSIFAWANQGEPLVNASGATDSVHPFSVWWGMRYLDPQRPGKVLK